MINSVNFSNNLYSQQKQDRKAEETKRYNDIYAHEMKHKQAAGSFGGNIVIERDSEGMPIGGHVSIKMPSIDKKDPQKTIDHADIVIKSAMAPSDPSEQDYKVAAEARTIKAEAESLKNNNKNQGEAVGSNLNLIA